MRYLVAMIFAIAVALGATLYVSSPVASWVVDQFSFESPDEVADLHSLVFMTTNIVSMVLGWSIGWAIGGALGGKESDA